MVVLAEEQDHLRQEILGLLELHQVQLTMFQTVIQMSWELQQRQLQLVEM